MAVDAASQELVLRLVEARDALLRSFSQILLSRSRWVGVLLFAAAAVVPMNALYGVCAVLMVLVLARWWNLAPSQLESGLLGYNSLLVGIGGAALLEPSPVSFAVVMLAAGLTLPITAAMKSALSVFDLPVLTLPFIVVFFLLLGVAPLLEIPLVPLHIEPWSRGSFLPEEIATALKSLGALFFVPRVEAGLLVLAALLLSSRIATLASVVAFVVLVLAANRFTVMTSESLRMSLGYNAALVAVALSGIWFVPSRSSFVLALVGVALSTLFALGLLPILARLELPLLILPFNLSLLVMLTAMRQRLRDQTPKAVDFAAGSPEQNLNTFNTRLARTQSLYGIRFRLPFLGKWRCTQSNDGEHTHQGEWRHGLDFEVAGRNGQTFSGAGTEASDYHCHKLPVLAAAAGTVVNVVDHIPDNPVGHVNLEQNWGNLVLIVHATGLYSMVAHLSPGSIKVTEGQLVKAGQVLGSCGNSGRSPAPHVHFQLQGSARVGAPTLPVDFDDVIRVGDGGGARVETLLPKLGDELRNLETDDALGRPFEWKHGDTLVFEVRDGEEVWREAVRAEIDLFGSLTLRSLRSRTTLYYEKTDDRFQVYDVVGTRKSVLWLLRLALGRFPLESASLSWTDHLPDGLLTPRWLTPLTDFVSPFRARKPLEIRIGPFGQRGGVGALGIWLALGVAGVGFAMTAWLGRSVCCSEEFCRFHIAQAQNPREFGVGVQVSDHDGLGAVEAVVVDELDS